MDILHLDVGVRETGGGEENVDPRIPSVGHLAADEIVSGEFGDRTFRDSVGDEAIWLGGVDADEAALGLDQLPRPRKFACEARGPRQVDAHPRFGEAHHRAGVGAMDRDDLARG